MPWAGSYVDRGHRWEENENFMKLRLLLLLWLTGCYVGRVAVLRTASRLGVSQQAQRAQRVALTQPQPQ